MAFHASRFTGLNWRNINMDKASAVFLAQQLATEFATRADEADRMGTLPAEDVAALRRSGYPALSVPRDFGGYGLSLAACVAAHIELAKGSPSTALVAGMGLHLFGHQRETRTWDETAYEQLCQAAANGGLFNSAASEPQLGSPSRGGLAATMAVLTRDGWLVTGHKTWTTGGRHLTHILVRANIDGENGVILVEGDRPGLRWENTWQDALSLRASDSHDLYLEDVLVPPENLVERGGKSSAPNLWFPMIMASVYLGAALAARDRVIQFALERVPTALGKPIATLPKIQRQIGEIDMRLQAAWALLLEVARTWTGEESWREPLFARVAAAKLMVTETAIIATDKALQIAGGSSITGDLPLGRYFRDVRAGSMQPPSGDTAYELIGRAAIEAVDRDR
jgi:alkylation response protein AidB-like acyl-CoA dehydrogenase